MAHFVNPRRAEWFDTQFGVESAARRCAKTDRNGDSSNGACQSQCRSDARHFVTREEEHERRQEDYSGGDLDDVTNLAILCRIGVVIMRKMERSRCARRDDEQGPNQQKYGYFSHVLNQSGFVQERKFRRDLNLL